MYTIPKDKRNGEKEERTVPGPSDHFKESFVSPQRRIPLHAAKTITPRPRICARAMSPLEPRMNDSEKKIMFKKSYTNLYVKYPERFRLGKKVKTWIPRSLTRTKKRYRRPETNLFV